MYKVFTKLFLEAIVLFGLIFLIIVGMAAFTPTVGQQQSQFKTYQNTFQQTISKEGKTTTKGITAIVSPDVVYFEVSATSHFTVGKRRSGEWAQIKANGEWGAIVERVVQADGLVVFHVNPKKAFYYKP